MKVDTLIRDTERFVAAPDADSRVQVSVLLSLSSCDETQARRAVESVLAQTLLALELIVVDDTCDNEVAKWLERARSDDPRISVLRHRQAIGIPAVGWIEAAKIARGAYFVLAREEDEFRASALEDLLAQAEKEPGLVSFGYVETVTSDEADANAASAILEDRSQSLIMLRVANFVARNAVLIPRDSLAVTGFVDPHLLLAQTAEWDFWRRFSEYFEMRPVDVLVGVRHVADDASLSLPSDRWAIEEWMRTGRNGLLKLDRVGEYGVYSPNASHGKPTRDVCAALASARGVEVANDTAPAPDDEGYVLVVVVQYDASAALYFDMLPEPFGRRVLIVPNHPKYYRKAMARASAVIFVRAVRTYQPCLALARGLGIRTYYFLDDNFPLLEQTGEARIPGEDFSIEALKKDLKAFDGVLLSSPQLLGYFKEHALHPRLLEFPVVCAQQEAERAVASYRARKDADEIVFAFMGGFARSKALWDVLMPALIRLGESGVKMHFIAPGNRSDGELLSRLPPTLRVTLLPWDHGYAYVVRRFARYAPDYMLLSASTTPNNLYKTLHPLLTARLIDAVAVLPFIDPYRHISDGTIALSVDKPFDSDAWYAMLRRIADKQVDVEGIKERNLAYCAEAFSGDANTSVFQEVVREAGGSPAWASQYRRIEALSAVSASGAGSKNADISEQALRRNAEELLALRRGRRYSWRHRILARPSDLWTHCNPTFWPLQRDSLKHGWRRRSGTLELSDSLHDKPYYDYEVELPAATIGGVALAIATDGPQQCRFVVELINPSKMVAARAVRELERVDLSQPVNFSFGPVRIEQPESWRIRLRARSSLPVYVYELVNRRGLKMFYGSPSPFMQLIASDGTPAPAGAGLRPPRPNGLASASNSLLDVKMVIEGDIPTNQIIGRLIEEALGANGTLDKVLVGDLTPDMVMDGGAVVLSRISSPSAIPMINWMNRNRVPFLYYIDDNFWEFEGRYAARAVLPVRAGALDAQAGDRKREDDRRQLAGAWQLYFEDVSHGAHRLPERAFRLFAHQDRRDAFEGAGRSPHRLCRQHHARGRLHRDSSGARTSAGALSARVHYLLRILPSGADRNRACHVRRAGCGLRALHCAEGVA